MQKPITSHISIAGIFITLLLILTIPLIVITTQNPQDIRQRAAEIDSPPPIPPMLSENDSPFQTAENTTNNADTLPIATPTIFHYNPPPTSIAL